LSELRKAFDPLISQSAIRHFPRQVKGCSTIGAVSDVKQFSLSEGPSTAMFLPYSQAANPFFMRYIALVLRTNASPLSVAEAARHAVGAAEPDLPVFDLASMEQLGNQCVSARRFNFNTVLLGVFAALALVLQAVGYSEIE
jgi:hypothetical protein